MSQLLPHFPANWPQIKYHLQHHTLGTKFFHLLWLLLPIEWFSILGQNKESETGGGWKRPPHTFLLTVAPIPDSMSGKNRFLGVFTAYAALLGSLSQVNIRTEGRKKNNKTEQTLGSHPIQAAASSFGFTHQSTWVLLSAYFSESPLASFFYLPSILKRSELTPFTQPWKFMQLILKFKDSISFYQ